MDRKLNVLCVEDARVISRLLVVGLDYFGITVNPVLPKAEDLIEHFDAQALNEVDVFVFDIRLPEMSGVELARHLRQQGETRPFVLMSAWPPPSRDELERLNATFIPKPFHIRDVANKIQQLCV